MKRINLIRRITFIYDYWVSIQSVKRVDSLYSYPLLVYLTLNKESVKSKYLNGKSMKDIVIAKANMMSKSLTRHLLRDKSKMDEAVLERYYNYCERKQDQSENEYDIEHYFGHKK